MFRTSQPCAEIVFAQKAHAFARGASRTHGDVPEPSAGPFEKVENLNLNLNLKSRSNGYTSIYKK